LNVQRTCFVLALLLASPAAAQPDAPAPAPPPQAGAPTPTPAQAAPAEQAPQPQPQPSQAEGSPAPAAEGGAAAAADVPEAGTPTPPPPAAKPAIAADPKALEDAKAHFRQGLAFAKSGDCSAAIVEFEAAYSVIPRPNMLYNIAQCQERLFRYDLAVTFYERYLAEAEADAPDRGAVTAALNTLANLLGTLHIESNVPAEVWVDDRLAGNAPGDVLVPAGGHSLEVRAKGYIPDRVEVRVVGRTAEKLSFTLVKAQTTIEVTETTGVSPTLFWIGASATIITAGVGGFFALQASSRADEAEQIDEFHPDREQAQSDVESSEFAADLSFAIAGVLAVGTTIVAFMTDWDGAGNATAAAEKEHSRITVMPVASHERIGVVVGGQL